MRCCECCDNRGAFVDFFTYDGRRYPVEAFAPWFDGAASVYWFRDPDGVAHPVGYRYTEGRSDLWAEFNDDGDRVRLYSVGVIMN